MVALGGELSGKAGQRAYRDFDIDCSMRRAQPCSLDYMTGSPFRSRTALIVPLVLLVVALLEDIAMFKLRQHVRDIYVRTGLVLVLTGVGFAFAAGYVGPWLQGVFSKARKGSKSGAGKIGIWVFYAAAYGLLYYAYLVMERRGAGALLPASLR